MPKCLKQMIKLKSMIKETLQIPDHNQRGNIMASLKKISNNIDFNQIKSTPDEVADWFISNRENISKSAIASIAGESVFYVLTKETSPKVVVLAFGENSYIHQALSIIKSKLPQVPKEHPSRVQYVNK